MWFQLLLAAQASPQARGWHHSGTGHAWDQFFLRNPVEAALIGLGISLLAGLLGVWLGKTPVGKFGKGVLYFVVCVALLVVAPVMLYHVQF